MTFDSPVVRLGMLVALAWLIVRLETLRTESAAAHAAINRNIDGLKQQLTREIDGLKQQLTKEVDGVKQDVRDVKQDVRMLTAHPLNRERDADDRGS